MKTIESGSSTWRFQVRQTAAHADLSRHCCTMRPQGGDHAASGSRVGCRALSPFQRLQSSCLKLELQEVGTCHLYDRSPTQEATTPVFPASVSKPVILWAAIWPPSCSSESAEQLPEAGAVAVVGVQVRGSLAKRLGLLGAMGGTQGLVGWWMVRSGLQVPPSHGHPVSKGFGSRDQGSGAGAIGVEVPRWGVQKQRGGGVCAGDIGVRLPG